MREHSYSTTAASAPPEARGMLVSIFVSDDHPLLRLKRALDWHKITAVMIRHWRAAGKNLDGGRGLPWPVDLYVPLLVLMWVESLHSRQMEKYISESVVARRFLDLSHQQLMHVRDHASIARAEAALGAAGKVEVNELVLTTAQQIGFTNGEILSADTTVQEPAIGYPHEPGILKGLAARIVRGLQKLKARGVKLASDGIEKANEISFIVKQHHLFAKTKEEKKKLLDELVKESEKLIGITKQVIMQVSLRSRARQTESRGQIARDGRGLQAVDPADQALDEDRESGDRKNHPRRNHRSPGCSQRQGACEIRDEVADHSIGRGLSLRPESRRAQRRKQDARREPEGLSRNLWSAGNTGDGRLRSRSELACRGQETAGRRSQKGRDPPAWTRRMDGRRERTESSQERARQDRREHRQTEEQKIRLLSSAGAQPRHARGGWPAGDRVGQFEYTDERFGRTSQSYELGARLNDEQDDEKEKVITRG